MNNYTFKFTPIETFFFGSEKHVLNEQGDLVTNYFVESNEYPQQTTLLGAIRYFILQQQPVNIFSNKKIQDKILAAEKIGDSSFVYHKNEQGFGIINEVGFLYWIDKVGQKYIPYNLKKGVRVNSEGKLYDPDGNLYKAKNHEKYIGNLLIDEKGNDRVALNEVVLDKVIVGNKKNDQKEKNIEGFYKQNQKYMKDGWAFAVDVKLLEKIDLNRKPKFVTLGGEKSIFRLEILENNPSFNPEIKANDLDISSIRFLSDTFITSDTVRKADFGVTEYISFRNLMSTVSETEDYRGLATDNKKQLKRSGRFNLLKRGSVLFFKDNEKLKEVVQEIYNEKNAKKTGFNQIIITKNEI